ncbi:MAG: hypothetical protein HDQ96_04665 [Lachnospiraceae bacterium]|nr:hypothetical protein [Lachnospiraceae bacterium]
MFDRFGEFSSAEEINETAVNLRKEGDTESIIILAKENGIEEEIAEVFIDGDILYLCDAMTAAIGKIDVESAELKPKEIMQDWTEYIKARCFDDAGMAASVRMKGKSLKGCIAALLAWSFENQIPVDKDILKKAKVNAGRVTLGIPGIGTAKKIITNYYMGKQV